MEDTAYDPDESEETVDIDKRLAEEEGIYPNFDPASNNTDELKIEEEVDKQEIEE